ncbi:hypothetical protein SAMN05421819_1952 [Bryocella elongata]|uniref:Dolichyl-phosphate-mannose-protein mannosyltransferase n=1 Tax=Bryocella elongata TaxID=863522 RepID=A0A1H5XTF8_9BACT|nr:hypothetical protein [Bryocella elongata]SEG14717.1 hypothetical protein SAMN05421819_1952 [Bryocella elongata]
MEYRLQRRCDFALKALLLCCATVLIPLSIYNLHNRGDWSLADWLINYSSGFVRRGLIGSGFLALARMHIPVVASVLLVQLGVYGVTLVGVWRIFREVDWTFGLLLIIFSPATLQFPLMDPGFALRKEILLYATLTFVLIFAGRMRTSWLILSLLLIVAAMVLSHEAIFVYLPYVVAALFLVTRDLRRTLLISLLPLIVAALCFLSVSHHPGGASAAQAICVAVKNTHPPHAETICGGAIDYLAQTSDFAREHVLRVSNAEHYWRVMPTLFLLSAFPFVWQLETMRRLGQRREAFVIGGCALLATLGSIGLFLFGTDWTRWVSIHAFCLMLLCGFAASRRRNAEHDTGARPLSRSRLMVGGAALAVYALAWNLALYQPRIPLGGLVHYVVMARRDA